MSSILITGKNSYIGNRFEEWVNKDTTNYKIRKISVRNDTWKTQNFKGFDTVLHLAGIAHVSRDPKMEDLYYKVNRDLTIELAKKAKSDGVRQFIFMSSIIVYGDGSTDKQQVIDKDTIPKPSNFYGDSKLLAEKGIAELDDEHFKVVVIRPPMIYGKGSKGNYPKLAKVAKMVPAFPDIDNQRSMLHVDNLCEFIKLLIDNNESGLFFPQNSEYTKTSEMVRIIGEVHGRKVRLTKAFNCLINPFIGRSEILNKMFGNLVFDIDMSNYKQNYRVHSLVNSIKETER